MSEAAQLRHAARAFAAAGDARAESMLYSAAQQPDDAGESWFALGLLYLAAERHEAARDAFIAAARARHSGPEQARKVALLQALNGSERFAVFRILYDEFEHAFTPFPVPRRIALGGAPGLCVLRRPRLLRLAPRRGGRGAARTGSAA